MTTNLATKEDNKRFETLVDPREFGIETETETRVPVLQILDYFNDEFESITSVEILPDEMVDLERVEKAKNLAKRFVKVRTTIDAIHKAKKEAFLVGGREVDKWKNDSTKIVSEREAKLILIKDHNQKIEQRKIAELTNERISELAKYGVDGNQIPTIAVMSVEMWDSYMIGVKSKWEEQEKIRVQVEQDKKEREERQNKLFSIGLKFDGEYFTFTNDFGGISINISDLISWNKEKFDSEFSDASLLKSEWEKLQLQKDSAELVKQKIEKQKLDAEKKLAEEKLKKAEDEKKKLELELKQKKELEEKNEAERLAKIESDLLKRDSQKVEDLISELQSIKTNQKYQFKSKKNQKMFASVGELLDKVITHIKK